MKNDEAKPQSPSPTSPTRRPLLDTDAAAERLNVRKQTLASWRCQGRPPQFIRICRKILYDPADLDAFIEANRHNSTSDRTVKVYEEQSQSSKEIIAEVRREATRTERERCVQVALSFSMTDDVAADPSDATRQGIAFGIRNGRLIDTDASDPSVE